MVHVWCRSSPREEEVAVAPKKAGRKRLPVDHITLDSLQEQGLFDVPIQVGNALPYSQSASERDMD